VYIAHTMKIPS